MNKLRISILFGALILLSSCGDSKTNSEAFVKSLPGGRSVTCIAWIGGVGYTGGLSCDWEHAK